MTGALLWAGASLACLAVVLFICVYAWITREVGKPMTERDWRLSAVDVELDRRAGVR